MRPITETDVAEAVILAGMAIAGDELVTPGFQQFFDRYSKRGHPGMPRMSLGEWLDQFGGQITPDGRLLVGGKLVPEPRDRGQALTDQLNLRNRTDS